MKIKVIGNSATIISNLTKQEIKNLEKFDAALILKDEKENELFRIQVSDTPVGNMSAYGVVYDATDLQTGNACVTIIQGTNSEDVKEFIAENAKAFVFLADLEEMAMRKIDQIQQIQTDLVNSIEFVTTTEIKETCENCDEVNCICEDENNTSENDVTNSEEETEND